METENKPVETQDTQVDNKPSTPTTQAVVEQETPEQINWKKFREAREVERKQKIEAEKKAAEKEAEVQALKAAMESVLNKQDHRQATTDIYQPDQDISEDEKIQRKIDAALAERDKRYEQERQQRDQAEMPTKLSTNFQDFNQVCSESNIDYLEYHYPEVYNAFKHMPDGYEKWASVYKSIKKLVPNTDTKKDQLKADKNFSKPQAMSIPGKTQVSDTAPQQLDEKRRSDNWARMQRVMKGGA